MLSNSKYLTLKVSIWYVTIKNTANFDFVFTQMISPIRLSIKNLVSLENVSV